MVEEQILSQPFKFFVNNAAIGMMLADLDGKIRIAHPAVAKRAGNRPQEISGRVLFCATPVPDAKGSPISILVSLTNFTPRATQITADYAPPFQ